MTKININNIEKITRDISEVNEVSFNYIGNKIYSSEKIQKMFGVFASNVIDCGSFFVRWKDFSWVAQKIKGTDIKIYIRTSYNLNDVNNAEWNGPFLNEVTDISDFNGKYLQFLVVLENDGSVKKENYAIMARTPIFQSIILSYFSSQSSIKFYTKSFKLGFVPQHVLLTYNGNISDDSIVRFAISGFNSIDSNDYQYINPNKIEKLDELSLLSNNIKILIEMIGDNNTPITIHEFALMFSGNEQLRLNKISSSSSSGSSSSSLEYSSSSLSSSSSSSSLEYSISSESSTSSESSESSSSSSLEYSSSSLSSSSSSSSLEYSLSSESSKSSSSSSSSSGPLEATVGSAVVGVDVVG